MTHLVDDPKRFAADVVRGFVRAHADRVVAVHGGVVRTTETPPGQVAVVLGGGSGHYPAFAGWGGSRAWALRRGLRQHLLLPVRVAGGVRSHGPPTAAPACSSASATTPAMSCSSSRGGGLLLADEASRPGRHRHGRHRLVRRRCPTAAASPAISRSSRSWVRPRPGASGSTRSSASRAGRTSSPSPSGWRCPGAPSRVRMRRSSPSRTASSRSGLGIHGEPGLAEVPLGSATDVADDLVAPTARRLPDQHPSRAAVLVNGLGATTYEEQFLRFDLGCRAPRDGRTGAREPEVEEHDEP